MCRGRCRVAGNDWMPITLRAVLLAALVAGPALAAGTTETGWIEAAGGRVERGRRGEITAVVLRGTWVGDGDLPRLRALPALERIDLSHTRITDEGLLQLGDMPTV